MKLSELVGKYIELRDQKAALKAEYESKAAMVVERLDKLEIAVLGAFDQLGVDSVKTDLGTAYRSVRTSATVSDRETFMAFLRESGDWSLLEVRAAKQSVEQFKNAHEDQLPPGISWRAEAVVNFRRAS